MLFILGFLIMTLDYNLIREAAKKANTSTLVQKQELTQKEIDRIEFYIEDMEKYIKDFAETGKYKFVYDCSNLPERVFFELATRFKQRNPLFFVVTQKKTQALTVDWSGKNEV